MILSFSCTSSITNNIGVRKYILVALKKVKVHFLNNFIYFIVIIYTILVADSII